MGRLTDFAFEDDSTILHIAFRCSKTYQKEAAKVETSGNNWIPRQLTLC